MKINVNVLKKYVQSHKTFNFFFFGELRIFSIGSQNLIHENINIHLRN